MAGVYAGVTFLNGQLMPTLLEPAYGILSAPLSRILVSAVVFFAPSNYLIGLAYRASGPVIAGVLMIGFSVFWMVVTAALLTGSRPTYLAGFGVLLMLLGSGTVVYAMNE